MKNFLFPWFWKADGRRWGGNYGKIKCVVRGKEIEGEGNERGEGHIEQRGGKRSILYNESQILINKIISINAFGIFGFFVYGVCGAYCDLYFLTTIHILLTFTFVLRNSYIDIL